MRATVCRTVPAHGETVHAILSARLSGPKSLKRRSESGCVGLRCISGVEGQKERDKVEVDACARTPARNYLGDGCASSPTIAFPRTVARKTGHICLTSALSLVRLLPRARFFDRAREPSFILIQC